MKIDGKRIADILLLDIAKKIKRYKKKPTLSVFLVEGDNNSLSFVDAKKRTVKRINGLYELSHFRYCPEFEDFANTLRKTAAEHQTTGIIIQQPLPCSLATESLYDYIPREKEIEGHKDKSPFTPPIARAVLTVLKYVYIPRSKETAASLFYDEKKDGTALKRVLKRKKIVIVGRGETGGKPIAKVFTNNHIHFINIRSNTPNTQLFLKEADIIISAVGKKVIRAENLKQGVVLISVGIRKEGDMWKADYNEEEIKDIAGFYTPVPGGVGPLDIAYLMYNLYEAQKMQF
ncbi:MAG TPA: bifunctional 5,10-methylenetetrahydrofolate dehydrogenase/5,10-methenyltetrahydrofolate cyclohydrolase [Patescibacteria group bacterium]|nr:bifunctional 5,10-methylenetetrahydrofolate dehydrogenase/5,10-methenyltetrahydrofolate cyclohydrolase [Patescibacteria group bacterium]